MKFRTSGLERSLDLPGAPYHAIGNGAHRSRRQLFPVLKRYRSAKFRRCAAESSGASNKIPASCVRDLDLSYARPRDEARFEVAIDELSRMTKKSTRVDFACTALRQAIIEQALPP